MPNELTEEIKKMLCVINEHDEKLRNGYGAYKRYFVPDIPDQVMNKLVKKYDVHLPVNSIVAYYDCSLLNSCNEGLIFTADGFYSKSFPGKAVYFHYSDIFSVIEQGGYLSILIKNNKNEIFKTYSAYDYLSQKLNGDDIEEGHKTYTVYSPFDKAALMEIISEMVVIDAEYGYSLNKKSGQIKKIDLPSDMEDDCKKIIHAASLACGGVGTGLAQIPLSDNAVIVPIQVGMIIALGKVFELDITEAAAKGFIESAATSVVGRGISQVLVGWIPVIGNAINTATAAGLTEAIGWLTVSHFYDRWVEDKAKGAFEGKKDGYNECSDAYERKLKKQAEEFLNQKRDFSRERDEYEKLLDEYEQYIDSLEKNNTSEERTGDLNKTLEKLRELKAER